MTKYPGLLKERTAAGTVRWRVRPEGDKKRKITLRVAPGESGFTEAYLAARAGISLPAPVAEAATIAPATFGALVGGYLQHLGFRVEAGMASPLTLRCHRSLLKRACDFRTRKGVRLGDIDADLPRAAFILLQDSFGARTGAADNAMKAIRAAYTWGRDRGFPADSPAFGIKRIHRPGGGAKPWNQAEVRAFLDHHAPGTTARRWLLLGINSLARIGDMHWLGPSEIEFYDGTEYLSYQPRKKGSSPVSIPLLPLLAEELQHVPDGAPAFLLTEDGRRFASSEALRNRIAKWTAAASLPPGRTQHGIRKAAAEILAAAGASQYEIMSVMSHSAARTSEGYTRGADRRRLAASALAKADLAAWVSHGDRDRGTPAGQVFGK